MQIIVKNMIIWQLYVYNIIFTLNLNRERDFPGRAFISGEDVHIQYTAHKFSVQYKPSCFMREKKIRFRQTQEIQNATKIIGKHLHRFQAKPLSSVTDAGIQRTDNFRYPTKPIADLLKINEVKKVTIPEKIYQQQHRPQNDSIGLQQLKQA